MDDSDLSDAGEDLEVETRERSRTNKEGVQVRGGAISWVEIGRFENADTFEDSDIAEKLKKKFSFESLTMLMLLSMSVNSGVGLAFFLALGR